MKNQSHSPGIWTTGNRTICTDAGLDNTDIITAGLTTNHAPCHTRPVTWGRGRHDSLSKLLISDSVCWSLEFELIDFSAFLRVTEAENGLCHTHIFPPFQQWVPGPVSAMFATWRQHNCLPWSQLTCNIIMWCRTLLLLSRLISTVMNKFHS